MTPTVAIGTSGWNYRHWRADFYAGVSAAHWLDHYATRFNAVEVNASFYGRLRPGTVERWLAQTPAGFCFAVKGHRYITHVRRLHDVAEALANQRADCAAFGDRLAAMLWQLPPGLHCDMERLEAFLAACDGWRETRHAIEFRHASWFTAEVAERLARHRIANCLSDAADWPLWTAVTTDLVYVRLHGHTRTYASAYAAPALSEWARRIRNWLGEQRAVQVYFDNDAEGAAPRDAARLLELVAADTAGEGTR